MRVLLAFFALLIAAAAVAQRADQPTPGFTRVRLVTSAGNIVLALDMRRAPRTSANFLAYVDDGRLDDTDFYRAARRKTDPKFGFIQGGIRTDARRMLPAIPLELTGRTGIKHLDGTISMARPAYGGSPGGNFFLTVGPTPSMDQRPGYEGYPAFGHVVGGMDVVKRILALPTCCGSEAMREQMIVRPVKLVRAERLDGTPRPTGRVKPWLIGRPR